MRRLIVAAALIALVAESFASPLPGPPPPTPADQACEQVRNGVTKAWQDALANGITANQIIADQQVRITDLLAQIEKLKGVAPTGNGASK